MAVKKKAAKKPNLVIVSSPAGDWAGLYVDGVLDTQYHDILPKSRLVLTFGILLDDVLAVLGYTIEYVEAAEDWIEERGELPDKLDEVELQ